MLLTTLRTVTFAFSEAPTSLPPVADTTAVGGTLSNLQQTDATHYTATFTGTANTGISNASVSVTAGSWQEAERQCRSGRQHRRLHRRHKDKFPRDWFSAGLCIGHLCLWPKYRWYSGRRRQLQRKHQ